jgi:hypothetical protein
MKKNFLILALLILLAGCIENHIQPGSNTQVPGSDDTTVMPTKEPRVTATSLSTPISTSTSTPVVRPTPPPTYTVDQAYKELLELLESNGGCQIPCIVGLDPLGSTSDDALVVLSPLSGIAQFTAYDKYGGEFYFHLPINDEILRIALIYSVKQTRDVIEILYLNVLLERAVEDGFEDVFDSPEFYRMLELFSLKSILMTYGPPNEIYIRADLMQIDQPIPYHPFYLLLAYPDKGFFIEYVSSIEQQEGKVIGCPVHSHFHIWTFHEEDDADFREILQDDPFFKYYLPDFPGYKPIAEATEIGVDEFYELYLGNEQYCLESPREIWPYP